MDGKIILTNRTEWSEGILFQQNEFERGLRELGFDSDAIKEDLDAYREATSYLRVPINLRGIHFKDPDGYSALMSKHVRATREFVTNNLKKLLGLREYRVEDSVVRRVKVPLFRLHSPKVSGSKVTYEESQSEEIEASWSVTVLGTGMGATQSFNVKYSTSFESTNGVCKLIFVPISMRVSLIGVYKGSTCLSKGLRTEMIRTKHEKTINKGIAQMPEAACLQGMIDEDDVEIFPLGEDSSDSTAKYERAWTHNGKYEVSLGIKAFNSETSSKAGIKLERGIALKFELPTGHNYELRSFKDMHGLAWSVE